MRILKTTLMLNLLLAAICTSASCAILIGTMHYNWAWVAFLWGMTWILCAQSSMKQVNFLEDDHQKMCTHTSAVEAEAFSANRELIKLYRDNIKLRWLVNDIMTKRPDELTPEARMWAEWVKGPRQINCLKSRNGEDYCMLRSGHDGECDN